MDSRAVDDRSDLADSLPSYLDHVWFRLRPRNSQKASLESDDSVRDQFGRKYFVHADSVWSSKPSACGSRHLDRPHHDSGDDVNDLETPPLGRCGAGALPNLGIVGDDAAVFDHMVESLTVPFGPTRSLVLRSNPEINGD